MLDYERFFLSSQISRNKTNAFEDKLVYLAIFLFKFLFKFIIFENSYFPMINLCVFRQTIISWLVSMLSISIEHSLKVAGLFILSKLAHWYTIVFDGILAIWNNAII